MIDQSKDLLIILVYIIFAFSFFAMLYGTDDPSRIYWHHFWFCVSIGSAS